MANEMLLAVAKGWYPDKVPFLAVKVTPPWALGAIQVALLPPTPAPCRQ